jgi:hypothetical protein
MGGGGDTTNVTNTGLGDDQYQTLADNQAGISDQITTAADDAETRYKGFDGRFDTLDGSISGLSTSMLDQFKDTNKAVSDGFTNVGTRFNSVDSGLTANNTAIGKVDTAVDTVGTDLTAGFGIMKDRFDTVDSANQAIQDDVTAGFSDQAQGFSDLSGTMTENTADIQDNMNSGFADTNDALAQNSQNIRDDVQNTQANVLEGQGNLSNTLSDLSAANDTYFDSLSQGQANMQSGQDEFRTSFDDYVERYSDDTTLANQTRADIQAAQAAGFDATRDSIGTLANTTAEGQQALAQQADANNKLLTNSVEGGFQQTQQTSENLRDVLSTQIDDTTSGIMSNQESMANTQGQLAEGQQSLANTFMTESGEIDTALVNQTKNLAGIAATQTDLDMGMRQNFQQLSSAFDDQGQLIQNSVDENGNTIMREMDQNGNLMLRALDATGRDMGSKIINVGQSMQDLQNLQRKQGSNMAMGNLSPASQGSVPTGGFMTPFTTTQ